MHRHTLRGICMGPHAHQSGTAGAGLKGRGEGADLLPGGIGGRRPGAALLDGLHCCCKLHTLVERQVPAAHEDAQGGITAQVFS